MQKWFHLNEDFKDNYDKFVEFGGYFSKSKQHYPTLVSYSLLKKEICKVLKNKRDVGQSLYALCI